MHKSLKPRKRLDEYRSLLVGMGAVLEGAERLGSRDLCDAMLYWKTIIARRASREQQRTNVRRDRKRQRQANAASRSEPGEPERRAR
jgi:hypothetical protein